MTECDFMTGRIHSFQSFGTVDGPGVRAVVFMQGCPLRCICCHNPDTWDFEGGKEIELDALMDKIHRLRSYFGKDGGVTVSGGEPLMQTRFVSALFERCHAEGIHCALDTSGCVYNAEVDELIDKCDLVLLDYKYTDGKDYTEKCGCSIERVQHFLEMLSQKNKKVWIRQVIIPSVNDTADSVAKTLELEARYKCIEKTEFLPFRKLCVEKYKSMGIEFPLENTPEADTELIEDLIKQARK